MKLHSFKNEVATLKELVAKSDEIDERLSKLMKESQDKKNTKGIKGLMLISKIIFEMKRERIIRKKINELIFGKNNK
ncbi:hypothetical protein [Vibrio parahaemolyticus]|uniref:hypothetical protein n=1 Tax=Vibrio parahaemolyticus TaxID=670 RepID=UPI00226A25C3|nr:hypothetical protein [Vibrio parahaemolyticus]MCX8755036.1 hypothetical protein [Vibrio parahaemolyticus]